MSVLEYWGVRKQCSDGGGTVKLAHYSYSDNLHNNYFGLFRGEKRKKENYSVATYNECVENGKVSFQQTLEVVVLSLSLRGLLLSLGSCI